MHVYKQFLKKVHVRNCKHFIGGLLPVNYIEYISLENDVTNSVMRENANDFLV